MAYTKTASSLLNPVVPNKYKYNGKEEQEMPGKWLDYGARFYDTQLGRWHSVDPLAEKYKSISPFVYCIDNPLKFVDTDGRKIKFAPGTSDPFKKDFSTAVNALNAHKAGGILASLEKSSKVYYISEASGKISSFDGKNTIYWAPREMLLTNNGVSLSPTTILNHEADHANQNDKHPDQQISDQEEVPDYSNKEEKRVITGSEQETAKKMGEIKDGEVTRTDHGGTLYKTDSPTSTEPIDIPIVSEKKEEKNDTEKK
jgi:RHS repeat-associated protein